MSDFWDTDLRVRLDAVLQAHSERQRGLLFEDLIGQLFESIAGMSVIDRNVFTAGNYTRTPYSTVAHSKELADRSTAKSV